MAGKRRIKHFRAMTARAIAVPAVFIVLLISAGLLYTFVLSPFIRYNIALNFLDKGEYDEAISAFVGLDDYRDSLTQTLNCINCRSGLDLTSATTTDLSPWLSVNRQGQVSFDDTKYAGDGIISVPQVIDGITVTSVADSAFTRSHHITCVSLPDTVTKIGKYAFSYCPGLKTVYLPDGITEIGDLAFSSCISLDSISLPNTIESLGAGVFKNCINLKEIALPASLTIASNSAFSGCTCLENVTFGDSISTIAGYAFSDCTSLKEVTLPDTLTYISTGAFSGCISITELVIPENVTELGSSAFDGCFGLTRITLPQGLNDIGTNTFAMCKRLSSIDYGGTQNQWTEITVGSGNDILSRIKITFQG